VNGEKAVIEELRPEIILYFLTIFGYFLNEQCKIGREYSDITRII
jgi:hypothetical protein